MNRFSKLLAATIIMVLVPIAAFAMDMLDDKEMAGIDAQTGVTIVFAGDPANSGEGALKLSVKIAGMTWGDDDGLGAGVSEAGYVALFGRNAADSANQAMTVTVQIKHLAKMTLDVAYTDASRDLNTDGTTDIPAQTAYIKMGVPDMTVGISTADKLKIQLSSDSSGTQNVGTIGTVTAIGLGIDVNFPPNSSIYIYAH